eukprot:comp17878_c0_seq1/m.18098 comp17878_c0_seq1/g.18098  ORF comp17878_c0_seq1/g.18098 comp17878_c0_seq1/m.18098 type:complete len:629 (-) comp17878_c0_seq1:641-2527(-)
MKKAALKKVQKLGTKGSAQGVQFQFDVTVKTVSFKILDSKWKPETFSIEWKRKARLVSTEGRPLKSQKGDEGLVSWNQTISMLSTLYKNDKNKFDEKDCRFNLEELRSKGGAKTMATAVVDLSQYADMMGVPRETTVTFKSASSKISNVVMQVTIHSQFLRDNVKEDDALSCMSGISMTREDHAALDSDDDENASRGGASQSKDSLIIDSDMETPIGSDSGLIINTHTDTVEMARLEEMVQPLSQQLTQTQQAHTQCQTEMATVKSANTDLEKQLQTVRAELVALQTDKQPAPSDGAAEVLKLRGERAKWLAEKDQMAKQIADLTKALAQSDTSADGPTSSGWEDEKKALLFQLEAVRKDMGTQVQRARADRDREVLDLQQANLALQRELDRTRADNATEMQRLQSERTAEQTQWAKDRQIMQTQIAAMRSGSTTELNAGFEKLKAQTAALEARAKTLGDVEDKLQQEHSERVADQLAWAKEREALNATLSAVTKEHESAVRENKKLRAQTKAAMGGLTQVKTRLSIGNVDGNLHFSNVPSVVPATPGPNEDELKGLLADLIATKMELATLTFTLEESLMEKKDAQKKLAKEKLRSMEFARRLTEMDVLLKGLQKQTGHRPSAVFMGN